MLGAVLFAACGSPDDGEDTFTFDPVPYVEWFDGRLVSVDPDSCAPYIADEVLVVVEPERTNEFESWVTAFGWEVKWDSPGRSFDLVLVRVPLGSVPDAIGEVKQLSYVLGADPAYVGTVPEHTLPTPAIPCGPREDR